MSGLAEDDGWITVWPPWIAPGTMVTYDHPSAHTYVEGVKLLDLGVVREVEGDGAWVWSINGRGKLFVDRERIIERHYCGPVFAPCEEYLPDDREGRRGCWYCGHDGEAHRRGDFVD